MSKMAEILLGKEKAQERKDTLLQLEKSIEQGDRPKASSFFKKLLNFEAQLGKSVVSGGMKFYEAEKERVERERAEKAGLPTREPLRETQPTSVFEPMTREKDQKVAARNRVDFVIRELQALKRVI